MPLVLIGSCKVWIEVAGRTLHTRKEQTLVGLNLNPRLLFLSIEVNRLDFVRGYLLQSRQCFEESDVFVRVVLAREVCICVTYDR